MKKYYRIAIFSLFLIANITHAQVGMTSNSSNKDAALDLNKTDGTNDKGLLLPRVALTSTTSSSPMSAHVAGMKVYNTNTTGSGPTAVVPGEYYNNGTKWIRIEGNPTWSVTGNAGTNPATSALGTTDAQDFVIKTNNTEKMRIASTGQTLIGTTTVPANSTAGLILDNGTTKGAIQIKDGNEADGSVLTSDANGVATWTKNPVDIYYSTVAQTFGYGSSNKATLQTSSPMVIKESGNYLITLRWWGNTDGGKASGGPGASFRVGINYTTKVNGLSPTSLQDSSAGTKTLVVSQGLPNANSRVTFTSNQTIFNLNAGDVITIDISTTSMGKSPYQWYTGLAGVANKLYMPSVIIGKL